MRACESIILKCLNKKINQSPNIHVYLIYISNYHIYIQIARETKKA